MVSYASKMKTTSQPDRGRSREGACTHTSPDPENGALSVRSSVVHDGVVERMPSENATIATSDFFD